ncbi:TrkA C-terminal domain-containing protein [Nafulsella turpanensis]|uniref:TrkA C-terminal domain-containing protein n=1 Tax=Nafulsella turpanensis TaxID=1265690 RepID=UPI00034C3164|nr:TrkA C-terminal domain-containing protein [Nafulsella turpanensis]
MHTGLSRQSAKFQARSAFTGVGYATKESENIVNHPLRRRIIMLLMLLGNAGIVSVVATLMLTMVDSHEDPFNLPLSARVGLLVAGIILVTIIFNSKIVNRWLSRVINFALQKYTSLNVKDYSGLLHLAGEYEISEIFIEKDDWLAEKKLAELALPREGLFILGINRKNGSYLGIPRHDTQICPGDTLIIYGRASAIISLSERKKGSKGDFERWLSEKENKKISKEEALQDQGIIKPANERNGPRPD